MTRGITSIGANAFEGCTELTQMKVWDTVTAIGENAFSGCTELEITYSGTANQWRQMGCKVNKTICSDGILWDFGSCGDNLVYMLLDDTLQIFVEEGMEGSGIMEDYASGGAPWYALRDQIATVSLAEGITSIGSYAFDGCCSGMSILTLPQSVATISANAFTGWTGLKHIYIESTVTTIEAASKAESPFYGCAEDLMIYCQAASKPSGWGTYWNYDTNGTVVSTTWNVTAEDFAYWSTLNKSAAVIEIPEGILQIPTKAFLNCTNLTGVTIPEGLITINSNAFGGCTGLTHIYIPESVTTIRASSYTYSPFSGCSENLEVYCHVDTRARGWGSYWNHTAYGVVLTTTYSCDRENYDYWSTLDKTAATVDIPEYITLIPVKAFYNRTTLTGVTIPDSVTVIHNNAFTGCSNLRHIFIPASVTAIIGASYSHAPFDGTGATLYCEVRTQQEKWEEYWSYGASVKWGYSREEYLEWCDLDLSGPDLVIPEGITSIPYRAFEYRSDLASVMIPETVRTIGEEAFTYCQGLTDITLPEGVETIGDGAFSYCTALLSVSIPASVTYLSGSMFQGSDNILYFWVDDLSSTYTTDVFGVLYNKDMTRLVRVAGALEGSYEIPESVTTIGPGAFQGCDGLKWVFIPDTVTTMEEDSYSSGTGIFADTSAYLNIFCAAAEKPAGWPEGWNSSRSAFFGCSGDEIEYWDKLDKTASVIEIPAGIAAIPNEAFAGCTGLTDVIIPEGVTGIGMNAFKDCTGLTRIHIPLSVKNIYSKPFLGCSSELEIYITLVADLYPTAWASDWRVCDSNNTYLTVNKGYTRADMLLWPSVDTTAANVVLPEGIETIIPYAFFDCDTLESVVIPDSVTKIENMAFYSCSNLTSVTIPTSVTTIKGNAFSGDENLTITYEGAVEQWLAAVGDGTGKVKTVCTDGTLYYWGDFGQSGPNVRCAVVDDTLRINGIGVLYGNDDTMNEEDDPLYDLKGQITKVEISDGITVIESWSFWDFVNLTEITLPSGVTGIGECAFLNCCSLTSVTIPEGVTYIGNRAFENCSELADISIPKSVTSIGESAFIGCQMTSVTIPEGVTSIADSTFNSCTALTSVTIQGAVTSIGSWAFSWCSSLTSITIPKSVISIGNGAFEGCSSMASITIPEGVTTIGEYAFGSCPNLVIQYQGTVEQWVSAADWAEGRKTVVCTDGTLYAWGECGENLTYSLVDSKLIISGSGAMTDYDNIAPWYGLKFTEASLPDGLTNIGKMAFYACTDLTSITIPESVVSIADYAFAGCSSLTSIMIPDSVTSIGISAFESCTDLTEVTLSQNMTGISGGIFDGCSSLTSITIPGNVTSIGNAAFARCSSLTSVVMQAGITSIGNSAFYECASLTSISIPAGLTSIGTYAFYNCTSLEKVTLPAGVTTIGGFAFSDCTALTEVTLGEGLTSIGEETFVRCSKLESIVIPETVTEIGDRAFQYCYKLSSVNIPESVTGIGEYAFDSCQKLTEVTVPASVTSIGTDAFAYCEDLTITYLGTVEQWMTAAVLGSERYRNVICSDATLYCWGRCGEDLIYYLVDTRLTITGSGEMTSYGWYGQKVTEVSLPEGLTNICNEAFYQSDDLTQITIPESVTSIGDYAFFSCKGAPSLTIPKNVTCIGYYAFAWNDGMKEIIFEGDAPTFGEWAFSGDTLTAFYPSDNATWTEEVMQNYGGTITWKAMCTEGHRSAVTPASDPTCTQSGWTEGTHCADCGKILTFQTEIPATGHSYTETGTTYPDCENPGYIIYTCHCGETYREATEEALGHDYATVEVIPPDCSSPGYTSYTCHCGAGYEDNHVDPLGHSYDNGFCIRCEEWQMAPLVNGVYQISNAGQLYWFSQQVNDVSSNFHAELTADIVINENLMERIYVAEDGSATPKEGEALRRWIPISLNEYHQLVFEGNNHSISGLYYNSTGAEYVGLFGYLTGGTIRNLRLTDSYIRADAERAGGIIGWAVQCEITNCHNEAVVSNVGKMAGGIAGFLDRGTFADCSNAGQVSGIKKYASSEDTHVGGIVGQADGSSLQRCSNEGAVSGDCVGGIIGWNSAGSGECLFADCRNTGSITGGTDNTVGGLVGMATVHEGVLTISRCYNTGELTASVAGGIAGLVGESVGVENCYYLDGQFGAFASAMDEVYAEAKTAEQFASGEVTWLLNGETSDGNISWYQTIDTDALPVHTGSVVYRNQTGGCCEENYLYEYTNEQLAPVTTHTEVVDNAVDPTCTETGLTEGKHCSACNEVLTAQTVVDALGHTEVVDNAVDPTCTETGLTEGKHCSVCNEVLIAQTVIDALGHTEVIDTAVAPTCTESGITEGMHCSVCNEILIAQTVVDALGHTEVIDAAVAPTCTETGLTEGRHCSVCEEVLTAQTVLDALGHSEVVDNAVAPTCTETGLTEGKHCSVCDEVLVAQIVVDALGHTEVVDNAVDPTCTETGLTEGKHCSVCNEVLITQTVIDALGHMEVIDTAVAPTCTESGITEGMHCSVCNEILIAQSVVDALGHTEVVDAAVTPTCAETGLTEGRHCSVCNEVFVAQTEIPAIGHAFANGICQNCGEELTVKISQEYIALQTDGRATLQAEIYPAGVESTIKWEIAEGADFIALDSENPGTVIALAEGTGYVVASITMEDMTVTARCRVDVADLSQIEEVQLSAAAMSTELYSKEYAVIEVLLQQPQKETEETGALTASSSAAMAVAAMGVSIQSAEFVEPDVKALFDLVPLDDRRIAVIPRTDAVEDGAMVAKSYTSAVRVCIGDKTHTTDPLTLTVKKTQPKLKATVAAFNSFYSGQSQEIVITGGTVVNITEDASKAGAVPEWLELEDGMLTLTDAAPLKNISGKTYVLVETEEWAIPVPVTVSVKNTYKAPGLKLSASAVTMTTLTENSDGVKLKLLCTSKKETLESLKVEDILAPEGYTVENFNVEDGTFILKTEEGFQPGKIALDVIFRDTTAVRTLTLTVKTAPVTLKLSSGTVTLNRAAADSAAIKVTASPVDYRIEEHSIRLTGTEQINGKNTTVDKLDSGELTVRYEDGYLRIETTDLTPDTAAYKLYFSAGGSKEAALTIQVISAKPTVTYKATGNMDLSFPEKAAVITPTFKKYSGDFQIQSMTAQNAKKQTVTYFQAKQEGKRLLVTCDGNTPVGTYVLNLELVLSDGSAVDNTVKVTVKRTAVKLKLSASKVSLNKTLKDETAVSVTCTTKGYAFEEPFLVYDQNALDATWQEGKLKISLLEGAAYGKTYPVSVSAYEGAPAAKLNVAVLKQTAAVKSSIKATGTLDVIRNGSVITVKPTYSNVLNVDVDEKAVLKLYSSEDNYKAAFAELKAENGVFTIDSSVISNSGLKYKAQLETDLYANDDPVKSSMISLKVKMGAAKLTVKSSGTTLFAKDGNDRALVWFEAKDEALKGVAKVEIKAAKQRNLFEIIDYGNGEFAIGFKDGNVDESLIGKSVTVTLNVFVEGNQTAKANTTAKVKLTIVK